MYQIAENVIFVQGAVNGAIYDFNSGDVYSINPEACAIIKKIINNKKLNEKENDYKKLLLDNNLFNNDFTPQIYNPTRPEKMPLNLVWLEITQACNMKCLHCYEGNIHKHMNNRMTVQQWINIIKEINLYGVKNVVVIGGEPCLFKELTTLLEELVKYNINTTLFTNAYFLNQDMMDLIIRNKEIISVKVSLYGHNSEVHDAITQHNGSFEVLHKNVTYLINNNVRVSAAIVIMKENEMYIDNIKNYLESIRACSH